MKEQIGAAARAQLSDTEAAERDERVAWGHEKQHTLSYRIERDENNYRPTLPYSLPSFRRT